MKNIILVLLISIPYISLAQDDEVCKLTNSLDDYVHSQVGDEWYCTTVKNLGDRSNDMLMSKGFFFTVNLFIDRNLDIDVESTANMIAWSVSKGFEMSSSLVENGRPFILDFYSGNTKAIYSKLVSEYYEVFDNNEKNSSITLHAQKAIMN